MSRETSGHDISTHHLLEIREPSINLVALRKELMFHPEIVAYAVEGKNFEDCIGRIGVKLDIALDGEYESDDLFRVLTMALRAKRFGIKDPHRRARGLVNVELEETDSEIRLVKSEEKEVNPNQVGAKIVKN